MKCRIKIGNQSSEPRKIGLGDPIFRELVHRIGEEDDVSELSNMKLVLDLDDVPPVDEKDSSQKHHASMGGRHFESQNGSHRTLNPPPNMGEQSYVRCVSNYEPEDEREQEVTLKRGEVVEILQTADRGWSFGKIIGVDHGVGFERFHQEITGWFPSSFTVPYTLHSPYQDNLKDQGRQQQQEDNGSHQWATFEEHVQTQNGKSRVRVEGGFSAAKHAILMNRLTQLRSDFSKVLDVPESHMQLQFSHTGLINFSISDAHHHMDDR
ncbi:hypothetical protein GUITHDRAFT_101166 [Guillardia theta CCMP2712]|uniref:SH3 domain-containing protein n=1 Tax=Guillardia theta (strain CCMP2712) TaxID=905079 RepID=L1JYQ0_GUITC|nr:hypothetical protein GUITHDRAFT_101166 [Guillardia theta CCMP2712]EKX53464.1 hypothetical protein GUITHDRAFT_101166 [Guillardia theta CCMP2712]|eukprot:XP_005840444.1 hypothetical protein GUITHDRAFT_101166 [Guillardia theta CCMP2712]